MSKLTCMSKLPRLWVMACYLGVILGVLSGESQATGSVANGLTLAQQPIYIGAAVPPIVMLDVTKDHQLYYRAYNDYTDLSGNGYLAAVDTTYNPNFSYDGYFDPAKCYTYNVSSGYFSPSELATQTSASSVGYCNQGSTTGEWSGNFMNWVSMSRMDILRKVLYGGMRSTDTTSLTVLERAFFPFEAHSWVKYYNGTDLSHLTPFGQVSLPTATATGAINTSSIDASEGATLTLTMTSDQITALNVAYGDQITAVVTANTSDFLKGAVNGIGSTSISIFVPGLNHAIAGNAYTSGGFSVSSSTAWTLTNNTYQGVSFCNTDYALNTTSQSVNTANNPPLIRVVRGDYTLWASNERVQCVYTTGNANTGGATTITNGEIGYTLPYWKTSSTAGTSQNNNGNLMAVTGLTSSSTHPPASRGLFVSGMSSSGKPDYSARVAVCVSGLIGTESCRNYPVGSTTVTSTKPYGLLQLYGEGGTPQIRFGLFTGSYDKNISGGVLRKNAEATLSESGGTDNEIDPATGEFVTTANGFSSNTEGIIWTINHLRQYGYNYPGINGQSSDGYMSTDSCTYQLMGMVHSGGSNVQGSAGEEGTCSSWGNPIGEMYLETLRYLAGKSPTSAFLPSSSGKDATLNLPSVSWVDPLSASTYCANLNILNFSASVNSYDVYTSSITSNSTQYAGISDLNGAGTGVTGVDQWTDDIGTMETGTSVSTSTSINTIYTIPSGTSILAGSTDASGTDGHCDAKTFTKFSSVNGICPEAPSLQGSYLISGLAYYAHTNRIRSDLTVPSTDTTSLKVNTFSVQLSSSLPVINIPVTVNGVSHTVTISPAYSLYASGNYGTGTLVNFYAVGSPTQTSGTFYADYDDSNQGGDYDQDIWGFISYKVSGSQITVTVQVAWAASANGQALGFNISGTTQDGPHFFTGAYGATSSKGFIFTDPTNITVTPNTGLNSSGGCNNSCEDETGGLVHTVVFTASTSGTATQLKDPLYYAAKWGGFKDINSNHSITLQTQFDSINNTTGANSSDGIPDNYFYVINPSQLGKQLALALSNALKEGSSSALAANSTSWQSSSVIYQAGFNAQYWSGWLKGLQLSSSSQSSIASPTVVFTTDDYTLFGATGQPTAASRVIITNNAGTGVPFEWANLSTAQKTYLQSTDSLGQNRLLWLRGDPTYEAAQGGVFRSRYESRIGDIANSGPIYVGTSTGQYDTPQSLFRNAYVNDPTWVSWSQGFSGRNPVIYVGANDGMLHGFWATNGTSPASIQGEEAFAFVPNAVYSKLTGLTAVNYTHYYTVDGSPNVADAYLQAVGSTAAGWQTVLVGGLGAGGRGVYALNVTNPANFSEANAASMFLWEFTNNDDPDLGWTFSKPVIAKMNNGRWAAIIGNGYFQTGDAATSAHSELFIIYLDAARAGGVWTAGTDYVKIDTGSGSLSAPGGLSTVSGIDVDGNGTVDYIYGGDLNGNVWKFDVSSSSPSSWTVAYKSGSSYAPLVTLCATRTSSSTCAASTQPIFNKPTLTFSPASTSGIMVYVGTGEYIQATDASNTQTQTMYGIYDYSGLTPPYGNLGALSTNESGSLLVQTITTATTSGSSAVTYRTITDYPFVWTGSNPNYLWLEDLPTTGERVTGTPLLADGVLFYDTYIPSTQTCTQAGDGWSMAVRYDNGGLYQGSIFDVNGDGTINANDPPSAGMHTGGSQGGATLLRSTTSGGGLDLSSGTNGSLSGTGTAKAISQAPRIGWRELFK